MLSRKVREWRLCTSSKNCSVEPALLKHRKLMTKASIKEVGQFGLTRRSTDSYMDQRTKEDNGVGYKIRWARTENPEMQCRGRQEMGERPKCLGSDKPIWA